MYLGNISYQIFQQKSRYLTSGLPGKLKKLQLNSYGVEKDCQVECCSCYFVFLRQMPLKCRVWLAENHLFINWPA